jgi:hypothetical protein
MKYLKLVNCGIDDDHLSTITHLTNLEYLDLRTQCLIQVAIDYLKSQSTL